MSVVCVGWIFAKYILDLHPDVAC